MSSNVFFLKVVMLALVFLQIQTSLSFAQETKTKHIHHEVFNEPEIYFITNREIITSDNKFNFTNHVSKNPSLSFFKANAYCSDSIRFNNLDSTAFLTEILGIKNQDWILFLHGDNNTLEHSVLEGLKIQNTYKLRVIIFSWPSKSLTLKGLENLETSYRNLIKSSNHFNSLINTMYCLRNSGTDFLNEYKLSLFVHSLGNYYLKNLVNQNLMLPKPVILFDNIIINASAVEQKDHRKWVEQLYFQNNIYITNNKNDVNLFALRIFSKHSLKLGERAKFPLANNAVYFDFTKTVGFRFSIKNTHTYFIGDISNNYKNIRLLYFEILHGLKPNLTDENRFVKTNESLGNFIVR